MMMMWHPISSQVACKVVFREMSSGGVCKVSGDPLKVPSEGPTECKSSRTTCKHAYSVCVPGEMHGCDTSHPPNPSPLSPPQCSGDTPVCVKLSVIFPSSTCQALLPVVSVPRQFLRFALGP